MLSLVGRKTRDTKKTRNKRKPVSGRKALSSSKTRDGTSSNVPLSSSPLTPRIVSALHEKEEEQKPRSP